MAKAMNTTAAAHTRNEASDRIRYFQGLKMLVTEHSDNVKSSDYNSENFRCQWNQMIWLELQAWHNARCVLDQDNWLMEKRQTLIPQVIQLLEKFSFCGELQSISAAEEQTFFEHNMPKNRTITEYEYFLMKSVACLSGNYFEVFVDAIKQVSEMLEKLSSIEQLFSTSLNLARDFPQYAKSHFQNKVKALCIWFNTSSQLALCFSTIIEMLEFDSGEYAILCFSKHEHLEQCNTATKSLDSNVYIKLPAQYDKILDAINKVTESSLRKYKVQHILAMILGRCVNCLIKSYGVTKDIEGPNESAGFSEDILNVDPNSSSIISDMSLLNIIQESFPKMRGEISLKQLDSLQCLYGLPDIQPLRNFILDVIFTLVGKCLAVRLEQAQACRQHCGSRTSLLTVQQVLSECKEVLQCSVLTQFIYNTLCVTHGTKDVKYEMNFQIICFKVYLLKMFHVYLDFVELSILAQLTGLSHVPHTSIDKLNLEWNFTKKISSKIDTSSYIPCACKMINICRKMFSANKDFLQTASFAIIHTKIENDNMFTGTEHESREPRTSELPQAGVLWFHRQRSESPHIARRHSSIIDNNYHDIPLLQFSTSVPLPNDDPMDFSRRYMFELGRAVRDLFEEVSKRSLYAIGFAKSLRKDLESAIQFRFSNNTILNHKKGKKQICTFCGLVKQLEMDEFIKVDLPWNSTYPPESGFHPDIYMLFAFKYSIFKKTHRNQTKTLDIEEENIQAKDTDKQYLIKQLVSCCTALPWVDNHVEEDKWGFLVVRYNSKCLRPQSEKKASVLEKSPKVGHNMHNSWNGQVVTLTEEEFLKVNIDIFSLLGNNLILKDDVTFLSQNGGDIGRKRRELSKRLRKYIEVEVAQISVVKEIQMSVQQLHENILSYCQLLVKQIYVMSRVLQNQMALELLVDEGKQLLPEICLIAQKNFNIGFECLRDVIKLFSGYYHSKMEQLQLTYLKNWMMYVMEFLPRGKGRKPRWANKGLQFLTNLSIHLVKNMTEEEYDDLKSLINSFLDHLIGTKLRKSKMNSEDLTPDASVYRSLSSQSSRGDWNEIKEESRDETPCMETATVIPYELLPIERIQYSIEEMEFVNSQKKFEEGRVGQIVETPKQNSLIQVSLRSIDFQWQRGNKIGEGSFGKVYTCVNMTSGKILAMKEISFQANDQQCIKEALNEITNFEGITHCNLVKYYGVELHRDQIYVFMEYCDAGTLEELSRIGLPEAMIQQYTAQIVTAVSILHLKGVVHRDIKGSNIFLTSTGLLKLGDFGSAVRLLNQNKTAAGEILSHHGTTAAYTAPEVVNTIERKGYGRAADIWSVGCVVIEMATGKRPWHDHEPFQILYKVGMGSKPNIPANLSGDGQSFLAHCFEVDPLRRWDIQALQTHPFVKVAQPEVRSDI